MDFDFIMEGSPRLKQAIERKVNQEVERIRQENESLKSELNETKSDLAKAQSDSLTALEAVASLYENVNNLEIIK